MQNKIKKNNLQSACPAKLQRSGGFTLLEILLVVGIIAILAGIVIVAINPSRQLATVRDTERKSDIKQISNAITQYYIDKGYYPPGLTATSTEICNTGDLTPATLSSSGINCSGLIDLTPLIPVYLTAIPKDPGTATVNSTHYKIAKNASANVYTEATDAEIAPTINVGSPSGVEGANIASSTDQGGGDVDITTGLRIHLKMNETSDSDNTIEDSQGNQNAVLRGAYPAGHTFGGKKNGAIGGFSSDNSSIYFANNIFGAEDSSHYSIALWFYLESAYTGGDNLLYLFNTYSWRPTAIVLYDRAIPDNPTPLWIKMDNQWDDSCSLFLPHPSISRWHHIALSRDGSSATVWYDGVNKGTVTCDSNYSPSGGESALGKAHNDSGSAAPVRFDDFRFYTKSITEEEALAIYNHGSGTEN